MPNKDRHQISPTPVRLPEELKAELKSSAVENDRSLNGEILNRLRSTFVGGGQPLNPKDQPNERPV